jgi:hypothetical protein
MRNLPTYDQFLLLEKSRTVQFFRDNPELLSNYAQGIEAHSKAEWDPKRVGSIDRQKEDLQEAKAKAQFRKKLERLDEVTELVDPTNQKSWTILDILSGTREGYSNWWDWDRFKRAILDAKSIDQFLKDNTAKNRMWRFPFEDYSTSKDITQYGKFFKLLKNNFDFIQKTMKWIDTALAGIKGSAEKGFERDLMKIGLSMNDLKVAMSHVENWTSMSRKKLDPAVWPLLQKISVDPAALPKVIYRGLFFDGAKIKDEAKFLKSWYPGSKPGASQGKATSWSVDKGTAAEFMTDQDFVKNREKGYYILLRWTVDPAKVIADLRNLPVDHKFWNQQEIIVSPDARDYEVDTIIPGSEGSDAHREFIETIKSGQGAWGRSKTEFAMNFMNTPYETLSPNQRMEFKAITKMTVGEFESKYPGVKFNAPWKDVPMPIWNLMDRYMQYTRLVSTTKNKIEFQFEIGLNQLDYVRDPAIKAAYEKIKKETDFNQFAGKTMLISDIGTIELVDADYYDMDISIKMPTKIEIGANPKEGGDPREIDKVADEALKRLVSEVGSNNILEAIKKMQTERSVSKNINIQVQ